MGYKHSPANAKLSAFMQKVNNTSKSPSRQNKSENELKRNAGLDAQSNMAQTSSNVVTSKPRVTTGTDDKGDFTTTEYDVTTTKKFQGTGTDKDAWNKNKDGVKDKYSSFEEFSKAAQAYRDKMTKSTKTISDTKYTPKKDEPKKQPKTDNVPHKTIGVEIVDKKAFKGDKQQNYREEKIQIGFGPNGPIYDTRRVPIAGKKLTQDYQAAKTVKTEDASKGANVYSIGGRDILSGGEAKDYLGTSTATSEKGDDRKSPARYSKTPMLKNEEKFTSVQKKARLSNRKQKKEIKEAQKSGEETTDMYAKKRATYVKGPRGGF